MFLDSFLKRSLASKGKPEVSALRQRAVIRHCSGSISMPMLVRPVHMHAIIGEPVPQNGSNTVFPIKENMGAG